ncbi:MAG: nuclear transport factor 2 family protein [Turicibacter sp.]|nr:nuclear transport factor 2 family protein [Turicibacter sp.]
MSDILKPVVAQLAAYNNRDIEKFIVNFSVDCVVEDGEGNVLMVGRSAMYESYKKMFAVSPDLHCRLASRVVVGQYVLDEERVTGRNGIDGEGHVVAVYRIENEEIVHVRFLR